MSRFTLEKPGIVHFVVDPSDDSRSVPGEDVGVLIFFHVGIESSWSKFFSIVMNGFRVVPKFVHYGFSRSLSTQTD